MLHIIVEGPMGSKDGQVSRCMALWRQKRWRGTIILCVSNHEHILIYYKTLIGGMALSPVSEWETHHCFAEMRVFLKLVTGESVVAIAEEDVYLL